MTTENLIEGQEVKTYKGMCKILNEPEKTGKSKQYQLIDWQRYFEYTKQGQKFIIGKVFSKPRDKPARRNNSKYIDDIEKILLTVLNQQSGNEILITNNELLLQLGLTTREFIKIQQMKSNSLLDMWKNQALYHITKTDLRHFLLTSYQKAKSITDTAIKSMQNRGIITHERVYQIHECCCKNNYTEIIDKNDLLYKDILYVQEQVLSEMNIKNINQLYFNNRQSEYYNSQNEILKSEYGFKILGSYNKIKYTCTKNIMINLTEDEMCAAQRNLNKRYIQALQIKNEKDYNKSRNVNPQDDTYIYCCPKNQEVLQNRYLNLETIEEVKKWMSI